MTRYDCEAIRDLLPALVRGEMLPHEASSAEQHLQECSSCREDAAIVRLIQETLAPVPDLLEKRVLAAVGTRARSRWQPGRLALAATLAAAVLGGSFAFDRMFRSVQTETEAFDAYSLSWAAAEDPLLHGSSELQQLSVEELEALLAELD